jgi:hypothetical protein
MAKLRRIVLTQNNHQLIRRGIKLLVWGDFQFFDNALQRRNRRLRGDIGDQLAGVMLQ